MFLTWRAMAAAVMLFVAVGEQGLAQERAAAVAVPQLVVSASDEVEVAPDRARLLVAVETRGRTAQAAAGENARISTAVRDALIRAGVPRERLQTQGLVVSPEYQYPREGGRPTVVGYQGRNQIAVEVQDLAKLSAAFDAALASGATRIDGPSFYLSNPDSARRVALGAAVRRARGDAEAMALAAGLRLGQILELTTGSAPESPVFREAAMSAMRAESDVATPVEAGLIRVRVDVTLRVSVLPAP